MPACPGPAGLAGVFSCPAGLWRNATDEELELGERLAIKVGLGGAGAVEDVAARAASLNGLAPVLTDIAALHHAIKRTSRPGTKRAPRSRCSRPATRARAPFACSEPRAHEKSTA